MNAVVFATWIAVGLLTGWLAGIVMKDGGHGLAQDLVLGVLGSSAAIAALMALDSASDAGLFATAFVAFAGAALVIIAQRKIWYAQA
jgi:uncharacterized membrane protein YeaQ/YmgE (transglycosylase-associated protein family)